MAVAEQLQWVNVDDFTPGIWYPLYGLGSMAAPPGAAQENLTYRCVASATGALMAAPASSYNFTQTMLGTGTRPPTADLMAIVASAYFGGVHTTTAADFPSTRPEVLTIMYGQYLDPLSGTAYGYNVDIVNYKLWAAATPTTYRWNGGAFTLSTMSALFGAGSFVAPYSQVRGSIGETAEVTGGLTLRQAVAAWAVPKGGGANAARMFCFPDRSTPGTDSVKELTPSYIPALLCCHQGRVAGWTSHSAATGDAFGTNAIQALNANDIIYFGVLDAQTDSETYWNRPIEENQSGVRVAASTNASEMLVIKAANGGALIRGDLDNPQVVRLPGLHSTGDMYNQGVSTPAGFFYGGDTGVYRWTGGDVTEHVSNQIDKRSFWDGRTADGVLRNGFVGQFGFSNPWVLVPNNFMFDTRFNSWWKLDDNTVDATRYFSYHESVTGNFYAVRGYIDSTETVVAREFDPSTGASSYSWLSQPIIPMPTNTVDVRAVVLVVEGTGTVQIVVTPSFTDDLALTSSAISVDTSGNSNLPRTLNFDVSIRTEAISVRIISTGSGGGRAPSVHSMRIGWSPSAHVPKQY
jgi:hypothetical protein